jgi:uncharacterized protein (TIGR01777 family)
MKVMIAGGRGFMGSALAHQLRAAGHETWTLTRRTAVGPKEIHWDGKNEGDWMRALHEMDAVVNTTGYGLEHWPWTSGQKRHFADSRIIPARLLASAICSSRRRPGVFVQISGINYYGLMGATVADESTPAAGDYLAQLTVSWEEAARAVEEVGVRPILARSAIVLDARGGLFPLMALPVQLFVGGRLGDGKQAVAWIHLADQVGALRFLLENQRAHGVYNLVAPTPTSNDQFMRAIAKALGRPFWLPVPAPILRAVLGEMSGLVLGGRYSRPRRLLEEGYQFAFPTIDSALENLFRPS